MRPTARLRIAKAGARTTGGSTPSKRSPVSGSSAELLEADAALRARRLLMRLRHRRAHCEEVAHVQRQRLDQDVLVTFEPGELIREAIQSLGDRGLAPVAAVGR